MSADNCIVIYIVKHKRGQKRQTIYIVKYMQGCQPSDFSVEELQTLLNGSLYTTNFNTAFRLAHHILNQVTYVEYGIIVCKMYRNVIISTNKLKDPYQAMVAQFPCIEPVEFFIRLKCWAQKNGPIFDSTKPADALFLKLLELPELKYDREYYEKMAKDYTVKSQIV